MEHIYIAYALMAKPDEHSDYNFFISAATMLLYVYTCMITDGELVYREDSIEHETLIPKLKQREILEFLEDNDMIYFDHDGNDEIIYTECDMQELVTKGSLNMERSIKNYC